MKIIRNSGLLALLFLLANFTAPAQNCTPPPAGLVGWYTGDRTANDYSATANHGYGVNAGIIGSARYAPGKVQRAFSFDGTNFVQAPDNAAQDLATAATLDAWVYLNQKPSTAGRIMEIVSRGDFNRDLDLGLLTDDRFYLYIANGQNVGSTTVAQTGVWYHVAGTWDANGLKIYVNGVLENTNPTTGITRAASPGVKLNIGEGALFADRRFVGLIDEVEIFNRALGLAEIQAIYNAGSFGKCKSAGNLGKDYDFDGDGRSDLSLFRPDPDENNKYWYVLKSSTNSLATFEWGVQTDRIAPADYDGDGKTDFAIWRENVGGSGVFYIYNSATQTIRIEQFGQTGDKLAVGDWDGDGRADPAVYRAGGQSVFYYRGSLNNPGGAATAVAWGTTGDRAVDGDYDGDGKLDPAVFRPNTGVWYFLQSSNGQARYAYFGLATDQPVPADYDADGITDVAVYRPAEGVWYIQRSQLGFAVSRFGAAADTLVPADYDGDGKTDVAVWRAGTWYLQPSSAGVAVIPFGIAGDKPVPAAYLP
ncbi:MAG: hypothetical protein JSS81_15535 [Acidobacteria bacterium]|nr:hypothetical protein [Acidobacteriota bacterium]